MIPISNRKWWTEIWKKIRQLEYYSHETWMTVVIFSFMLAYVRGYFRLKFSRLFGKEVWIKFASRKLFRQCNNTQSEKEWFLCMAEVDTIVANLFPTYWWYWETLLLKMGCNQSRGNGYEPIGWSVGHFWEYCPGTRSLGQITAIIFKDRVPVHLEVPYLQMICRYLTIWPGTEAIAPAMTIASH